ncbi:hypothetical protein HDU87_006512 [Geranomyces variabilis]|uniref:Glycosyl transferase family 1 domain-containing protein n=1 Tax=Geranomyces variabilis TaxID=109894 RepID=A0AAD5XKY9_9FUNG|nr:hypothetical protein HDU87_006512 [Geranomyces variabilis]
MHLAIVHTLGGGIVTAVGARLDWLNRSGGQVHAVLVAPEKRNTDGRSGLFFATGREPPATYHHDYERAVAKDVVKGIRMAYEKKKFDAIDAHDGTALIAAKEFASTLPAGKCMPIIHTIHSRELIDRLTEGASGDLSDAIAGTDLFISVSQCILDEHRNKFPDVFRADVRMTVVGNAIPKGVAPRDPLRSGSEVQAIFVGRLETAKGFDLLIEAATSLRKRGKNVHFSALGSCEDLNLATRAENAGIELLPKAAPSKVYEHLRGNDIFVFPSRNEACSMALLEAIGSGLAVVASNIEANIETAGHAALTHADGDAAQLEARISEMLDDMALMQSYAQASRERADDLTPERVFANLDSHYLSLEGWEKAEKL